MTILKAKLGFSDYTTKEGSELLFAANEKIDYYSKTVVRIMST